MLTSRFTTEELAHLSEREAVRRHFALRNLLSLRWLTWIAVFGAFGVMLAQVGSRPLSSVAHFLIALAFAIAVRQSLRGASRFKPLDALGSAVQANARFTTVLFFLVQITAWVIVAAGSEAGTITAAVIGAYLLVVPRLAFGNTLLLYGWLAAALVIEALFRVGQAESVIPLLFGGGANILIALAVALGFSRRARRTFVAQWRSARSEAIEQLRMKEELEFAREIQLSMLPMSSPPTEWLDIASLSLPATEVGGDYYDYFPIDRNRLLVVIGDVAGHGLASGIVLSGIRAGLSLLAEDVTAPLALIQRLDRMVRNTSRHRMLVTLQLILLDRSSMTARVASAGHPPLLLRRNGEVSSYETASLPLGTKLSPVWTERAIEIRPGDTLVLQTDGLYEAADADGSLYGFERLEEVLHRAGESPGEVRDAILRDLWSFRGEERQSDDVTIVVLRVGDQER
ncbi:MAG: PP2C family protein-serine/threonine phosphatase [Thermoanaerobaculia bacterium]